MSFHDPTNSELQVKQVQATQNRHGITNQVSYIVFLWEGAKTKVPKKKKKNPGNDLLRASGGLSVDKFASGHAVSLSQCLNLQLILKLG